MSIYDPIDIGPLRLLPSSINGDAVHVDVTLVEPKPPDDALREWQNLHPYDPEGGRPYFAVPVRVWEAAQGAQR